jgi:hypothetical protein
MKNLSESDGAPSAFTHALPLTRKSTRSQTYVVIAVIALMTTLAGFSFTYFVPLTSGTFTGRSMLHVHGIMYFAWLLLFILQPALVRAGNTQLHRQIGVAGFVLAGFMVIMGIAVAVTGARINSPGLIVGGLQAKQFMLIPFTDMLLFTIFLAFSLANLKKYETHKRLMVLATLSLIPAAIGRITAMMGVTNPALIILATESLLVGVVLQELYATRKLHPAYKWGAALMLVVHLVRFPLAGSEAWTKFAEWLIR